MDAAEPDASVPAAPFSVGLASLSRWARDHQRESLADLCSRYAQASRAGRSRTLAGPTGERNIYTLAPREAVLCLADDEADRLVQLAAVLAVGSTAVWPAHAVAQALIATLPAEVRSHIVMARDWQAPTVHFDVALHHGSPESLLQAAVEIAARPGPIVGLRGLPPGSTEVPLEALVIERSLSVNTAAAGGNASLMTIG